MSGLVALGTSLIGPVTELVGKFVRDKDEAARLAHEIASLAERQAHDIQVKQIEVNKVEAAHPSTFVSGWRPFIGWVCGVAMGFNYLAVPVLTIWYPLVPLDIATMFPVLLGLLGLGGFRTAEKFKGVARVR